MGYDIISDDGIYWIVDPQTELYVAGPFITSVEAEFELAAMEYTEPPENDLEP